MRPSEIAWRPTRWRFTILPSIFSTRLPHYSLPGNAMIAFRRVRPVRLAVISSSGRMAGGIETYLDGVLAAFDRLGHELAFWHEVDAPATRERITLPAGTARWCVSELGEEHALRELEAWR